MALSGILLLDKDEGWTSQDCVSKLRGILHERRIGHAGTLDPLATGLLVVLVGRATRAATFAEAGEKEYLATVRWGTVTDTQDITGTVLSSSERIPSPEDVQAVLPQFTGEILQIPPMYSAIKVHGQKLYAVARRGGTVERDSRPITIFSLDYLGRNEKAEDLLRVHCSKGTYIRTLCHDLGEALGCGGCMAALRRTSVGAFSVDNAVRIADVTPAAADSLLGTDTLFPDYMKTILTEFQEHRLRCGNSFPCEEADGSYRFYGPRGDFLAIGTVAGGTAAVIKNFYEVE